MSKAFRQRNRLLDGVGDAADIFRVAETVKNRAVVPQGAEERVVRHRADRGDDRVAGEGDVLALFGLAHAACGGAPDFT